MYKFSKLKLIFGREIEKIVTVVTKNRNGSFIVNYATKKGLIMKLYTL